MRIAISEERLVALLDRWHGEPVSVRVAPLATSCSPSIADISGGG